MTIILLSQQQCLVIRTAIAILTGASTVDVFHSGQWTQTDRIQNFRIAPIASDPILRLRLKVNRGL